MMPDRDGDAEDASTDRVNRLSDERRKLFEAISGNGDLLRKIRAERNRSGAGAADSVQAAGFGAPTPEAAPAPAEPPRAGPEGAAGTPQTPGPQTPPRAAGNAAAWAEA